MQRQGWKMPAVALRKKTMQKSGRWTDFEIKRRVFLFAQFFLFYASGIKFVCDIIELVHYLCVSLFQVCTNLIQPLPSRNSHCNTAVSTLI